MEKRTSSGEVLSFDLRCLRRGAYGRTLVKFRRRNHFGLGIKTTGLCIGFKIIWLLLGKKDHGFGLK